VTIDAQTEGFQLTDEKDASRYTLMHDGTLVSVLDYRDDGRTVALTRAFTIPTFRGRGYAAVVTEGAVADIESRGDRVIDPVCWYVADWFELHPEKQGLLRRR
jgi:predicted GNAT family acetyltransferase